MAPAASSMAPAAALMDELLEEIFLRIPPDDPARLLRAALVCKRWGRIVYDPGFRRRFREFHRTPPMLGFLCSRGPNTTYVPNTYFVSTSSFRTASTACLRYKTVDARHGRVLLHLITWTNAPKFSDDSFEIWVPIAGAQRFRLPSVPRYSYQDTNFPSGTWNAAVLCATDACAHLECHSGPFLVVFVTSGRRWDRPGICALVYSSEAAAWSHLIHAPRLDEEIRKSVLKFDISTREMSLIDLPQQTFGRPILRATREMSLIDLPQQTFGRPILRATEDSALGLTTVCSNELYLWPREIGHDEDVGWAQNNTINLTELLRADEPLCSSFLTGSADGLDIILVCASMGIFTIHLKSLKVTKVCEDLLNSYTFPYMSFSGTRLTLGAAALARVIKNKRLKF